MVKQNNVSACAGQSYVGGKYAQSDIELILDFAALLGCKMLHCGANLERANDTMNRICLSYHLTDVSIFSLSSIIQISARTQDGQYAYRQIAVPEMDTHLERLARFNSLSRKVCSTTPEPSTLKSMLDEAEQVREYSPLEMAIGRIIAFFSLCLLFDGTVGDGIVTVILVLCMNLMKDALYRRNVNQVIANMLCTFFAGTAALFFVRYAFGDQYFIILISCSMTLVPGIPFVNAFRNILCGNEMNGILEMLKAIVETFAIVLGFIISIYLFGGVLF